VNLYLCYLQYSRWVSTVDEGTHVLSSATELMQFIGAFLMYQVDPNQPLGAGRALKAQVNAATSVADVEAVVDNR